MERGILFLQLTLDRFLLLDSEDIMRDGSLAIFSRLPCTIKIVRLLVSIPVVVKVSSYA